MRFEINDIEEDQVIDISTGLVSLTVSDTDCSKRWGYVRDYYVRRRGKPFGEAAKKRAVQLSFLNNYSTSKRSTSNICDTGTKKQRTDNNGTQSTQKAKIEENSNDSASNSNDDIFWETDDDSASKNESITVGDSCNIQQSINSQSLAKKEGNIKFAEERMKAAKQIAERQQQRSDNEQEQDETDLFCASMAKILKKLPALEQAQLRLTIATLVGNAEVEYLSRERGDCC